MDILKSLGIGQKSSYQKERDASPVLSALSQRRQPTFEEIQEQERLNRASGVTFPRYQGNVALSAGEKLRNIGGLTYVVPADPLAAPINTTGIDLSADIRTPDSTPDNSIPPMSADGMGGYSQGGMFSPPKPFYGYDMQRDPTPSTPTSPDFTPTRPTAVDPTRETQSGNMQQEVIPVSPDAAISTLMARLTNYYTDDTPAMPVRRQDVAPVRQVFAPQPEPMQGPGLMTPQLPQPQMPNLDVQAYAPDMFRGQLPMPRPTEYTPDMFTGQLPMPKPTSFNPNAALESEFPMLGDSIGNIPIGTQINEQGDLVDARTGAVGIPGYQPTVTRY